MEEDQMNDGMDLYRAYIDAGNCAEALLTAYHIKLYQERESSINIEAAQRHLSQVAEALGYTLTHIKAEVLEAAE
jgi:hypothetical protein